MPCPIDTGERWHASGTGQECSSSTGRSTARSRGATPTAPGQGPCTSVARSTEIAAGEAAVHVGRHPEQPFVLLAQQTLFDPARAPVGHAHGMGLLPRAERVDDRHDRPDRGSGRALRAGFQGQDPRPPRDGHRRSRASRRQLHRRRHQRWRRRPTPVPRAADGRAAPVADTDNRRLPLLQQHSARAPASTACAAGTPPARFSTTAAEVVQIGPCHPSSGP